jgi:hypothetical protein
MSYRHDRRDTKRRNRILATMKTTIASHISRVCMTMDRVEFDRLVERMAITEIKYSLRSDVAFVYRKALT